MGDFLKGTAEKTGLTIKHDDTEQEFVRKHGEKQRRDSVG